MKTVNTADVIKRIAEIGMSIQQGNIPQAQEEVGALILDLLFSGEGSTIAEPLAEELEPYGDLRIPTGSISSTALRREDREEMLTTPEAAEELGRNRRYIRRLCEQGIISAWKSEDGWWRIPRSSIERYKELPEISGHHHLQ